MDFPGSGIPPESGHVTEHAPKFQSNRVCACVGEVWNTLRAVCRYCTSKFYIERIFM